MTWQ